MESTSKLELASLSERLKISVEQVRRTIELLVDGNTLPFITRFRRDQTGGLDESQIREIRDFHYRSTALAERKDTILKSIGSRDELTPELEKQIKEAESIKLLEDLYLPFKRKKETRSSRARQRGLEPLADEILAGTVSADQLDARAAEFIKADEELPTTKEVLDGARDIIAEKFSERIDVRQALREVMSSTGILTTSKYVETESESNKDDKEDEQTSKSTDEPSTEAAPTEEVASDDTSADTSGSQPPDTTGSASAGDTGDSAEAESVSSSSSPEVAANDESSLSSDVNSLQTAEDAVAGQTVSPEKPEGESGESASGESASGESASGESTEESPESTATKSAVAKVVKLPAGAMTAEQRRTQRREARRRKREQLESSFKNYFEFSEQIGSIPPHRVLAINRGERVRVLRVRLRVDGDSLYEKCKPILVAEGHAHAEMLEGCARDSLTRMLIPSLERELRRDLTEKAEAHALSVFARNLRQLLLQPPVRKRVLAIDPGLRYGCKAAALDEYGNLLDDTTIHALGDADRVAEGRRRMKEMILKHNLEVIAIGNGTGSRQAETTVATLLETELADQDVSYVIVNEAGASVYSTGQVAGNELPDADVRLRGAVSIGRRLLDPLSELVKIDPGNIGVGLYQHDVKLKHLQKSLDDVVQSCVNYVGVDVNTASPSLLKYVSGLNQRTAREIYEHRQKNGPFASREKLKEVPGVGEATFVQSAGFLKIHGGDTPLDATWVHPESYESAKKVLSDLNCTLEELAAQVRKNVIVNELAEADATDASTSDGKPEEGKPEEGNSGDSPSSPVTESPIEGSDASNVESGDKATSGGEANSEKPSTIDPGSQSGGPGPTESKPGNGWLNRWEQLNAEKMAADLGIGSYLFDDLVGALRRPGRDPREDFPPPLFRRGIMKLEDLQAGMELSATVLNVVDFGAFVDIGLRDSGLVHISQLADQFIRDPHEIVSVGDIMRVWVIEVDKRRRRVSLTAIAPGTVRQKTSQPTSKKDRPRRRPDKNRKKNEGGNRRGASSAPRRKKPKAPAVPITDGMKDGSEPMRTFGDLAQFFQGRKEDKPSKKSD